jgi:membrane protease subunit (stomatin/prohibitin family)
VGLGDFIRKQFVDVIEWVEPENGLLACRFPMQDREIQSGARLTVRESQVALFVNEGRLADHFGPGLYRLATKNLPLLTNLMHWDKAFESPFKSDVYFFSTRTQIDQKWGTAAPVTMRDAELGSIQVRAHGIYSYSLTDPRAFHRKISGTRDVYRVADLEGQLRSTIVGRVADTFASSRIPFFDMAGNQVELAQTIAGQLKPDFAGLGLTLRSFVVQSLSVPDEIQKRLEERIGMAVVGDTGRYTQFQTARSLAVAAGNEGGGAAAAGVGLGAGMAMAQNLMAGMKADAAPAAAAPQTRACPACGKQVPLQAKFCPECGKPQA